MYLRDLRDHWVARSSSRSMHMPLLGSASSSTPGTLSKRRLLDEDDDLVGTSDYLQIAVRTADLAPWTHQLCASACDLIDLRQKYRACAFAQAGRVMNAPSCGAFYASLLAASITEIVWISHPWINPMHCCKLFYPQSRIFFAVETYLTLGLVAETSITLCWQRRAFWSSFGNWFDAAVRRRRRVRTACKPTWHPNLHPLRVTSSPPPIGQVCVMSIFSFALYWLGGRTGMQPWAESVSMVVRKTLREAPLLLLLPSAADVVAWWWCCCCCCCCCSCPEARMFHWSRAAGRGAPLCHGWLARASHRAPRHHSQEGEAMLSASSLR